MRKAVLLQNVARPPDAFVGNPDRLVVTTGKIGGLQKIVERLPVEATPAGTGDLVVMVPLEALQIKEREGQFLDAGLNGIVSQSVFIVFLFLLSRHSTCCGENVPERGVFRARKPKRAYFFTFSNASLSLSHS